MSEKETPELINEEEITEAAVQPPLCKGRCPEGAEGLSDPEQPAHEPDEAKAPDENNPSVIAASGDDSSPCTGEPPKPEKEKKSVIRRIIGVIGYTVIIALMAIVAFIMFSNMSGKATFIFGRTAMWVKTQSMSPEIPEKSYILVRQATASDIKVGDVIVFISSDPSIAGSYNTHRVLEVNESGEFVTKGDNNLVADQYTAKPQNVIGIYERNLPVMTAFGRVMSTTLGIMITFTMIFVIFLIIYVPDMIKISKRRTEEAARIEKARVDALVALEVAKLQATEAAKKAAEAKAAKGGD